MRRKKERWEEHVIEKKRRIEQKVNGKTVVDRADERWRERDDDRSEERMEDGKLSDKDEDERKKVDRKMRGRNRRRRKEVMENSALPEHGDQRGREDEGREAISGEDMRRL